MCSCVAVGQYGSFRRVFNIVNIRPNIMAHRRINLPKSLANKMWPSVPCDNECKRCVPTLLVATGSVFRHKDCRSPLKGISGYI